MSLRSLKNGGGAKWCGPIDVSPVLFPAFFEQDGGGGKHRIDLLLTEGSPESFPAGINLRSAGHLSGKVFPSFIPSFPPSLWPIRYLFIFFPLIFVPDYSVRKTGSLPHPSLIMCSAEIFLRRVPFSLFWPSSWLKSCRTDVLPMSFVIGFLRPHRIL